MDMASYTINDLHPFVRQRDLLLDVNDDVERLKFHRYDLLGLVPHVLEFLSRLSRGGWSSQFFLGCYFFDNGGPYNRLPNDVENKAVRFRLVLVLLPMLFG
jgi:hypothetical protein